MEDPTFSCTDRPDTQLDLEINEHLMYGGSHTILLENF